MKFDKPKLGKAIADVEKYYRDLIEISITKEEDLEDKTKFYAVSMLIFSLGNDAIEIGNQIVAAKNIGVPGTYEDIFNVLKERKIIDDALFKKLIELTRLRNTLAHRYFNIGKINLIGGIRIAGSVMALAKIAKTLADKEKK